MGVHADTLAAKGEPTDITEFQSTCADEGKTAECCVLPIVSVPDQEE